MESYFSKQLPIQTESAISLANRRYTDVKISLMWRQRAAEFRSRLAIMTFENGGLSCAIPAVRLGLGVWSHPKSRPYLDALFLTWILE